MKKTLTRAGLAAVALAAIAFALSVPGLAEEAAPAATPPAAPPPNFNKGDAAWMMTSTVLVLLMTIPGLALFYAGLVRPKNALSVLTHVFYTVCVVMLIWVVYGYSITFTGGTPFIGGFDKLFLRGVTGESPAATFTAGVPIPEIIYICFQMTFAAITPALIVGAFAERMKFSAVALFVPLWVTFVYFPIAHMVWYWAGPDAITEAAKALAGATDAAAKEKLQAALDAVNADSGLIFSWGALDFAGGTVVHINAGLAGLIGALMVGRRIGYGRELMPPHSLVMTLIGASLLWVGWFGFNAGSALEATGGGAGLAMINTFVATAAAALSWLFCEWLIKGKASLLGALSGCIAGLVAVTPAAGLAGPMGALVLGLIAGVVCLVFCTTIKNALGYDDALDVFGVHCVGGILGAILTGVLVNPALGGTGVMNYETGKAAYDFGAQIVSQLKGVGLTIVWCAVGSVIIFKVVDILVGLRVSVEQEREGLDLTDHGERAYTM